MAARVADLTVDELHDLLQSALRELVEEIIEEKIGMLDDPDEGMELRPEVAASLERYLLSTRRGKNADEVFKALGLDDDE